MIDLSGLASIFGGSLGSTFITLGLIAVIIYFIQSKIQDHKKRIRFIIISVLAVLVLLGISGAFKSLLEGDVVVQEAPSTTQRATWQEQYAAKAKAELPSYTIDTENTPYYDYDNKVIADLAYSIQTQSSSSNDAVVKTLDYVYKNVEYVVGESDNACFEGTAPSIIQSGRGQCDTQSIAVISVLRKMGIAAKPVGGCIVINPTCKLQAMFQSIGVFRPPQYTPLTEEDLLLKDQFSRTLTRDQLASREGGLHAWVVAWLPDQGWVALEATNGQKADTKCYYYHVELYPEDQNRDDICVSKSRDYAKACQLDDLNLLNQYGLGIVNEVPPK
jgi:transglutaminase-like putative cysteine protease